MFQLFSVRYSLQFNSEKPCSSVAWKIIILNRNVEIKNDLKINI